MAWTKTKYDITNNIRDITDFKPDSFGSKYDTKFGGFIFAQYGELKEELIPENVPLNQKFLVMITFSQPEWTLKTAKKWFAENEATLIAKITLNLDSTKKDSKGRVTRYDLGGMQNTVITPQGYLKTDGYLTRTGVFVYHRVDGTEFRELRLPEEVFDEKSMQSFENVAVCNGHPTELLDSKNTSRYSVGHSLPGIQKADDKIKATLLVTDELTIKDVQAGKNQLSNGYTCDLEITDGEYEGEHYDAIQRNIVGNHIAIVDKARGGPSLRLTLDSEEDNADIAFMVNSDSDKNDNDDMKQKQKENENMAKFKVDDLEIEVPEGAASIISNAIDKRDKKIDESAVALKESESKLETLQGKLDGAEAKLKEEEGKKLDEDAIAKLVNDRAKEKVVLLDVAGKLLSEEDCKKLDEMSDQEIQIAVIQADPALKDLKLDGKSSDYLQALFEGAILNAKGRKDKADGQGKKVTDARKVAADSDFPDSEKARKDSIKRIQDKSRSVESDKKEE